MTSHDATVMLLVISLFAAMHPQAAVGAAFGCMFFLAVSNATGLVQKAVLTLVSWGAGYSVGLWIEGSLAMLAAFMSACFAVVVLTSLASAFEQERLPLWLVKLIKIWRGTK